MLSQPLGIRLLQMASSATGLLLQWWVQSTVVIGVGLAVAFWLRHKGPALQSAIYRATLVVAMVCPLVGALLSAIGISIPSIALPTVRAAAIEDVLVKVPAPPEVKPVLVAPSTTKHEPHTEVAPPASPAPSVPDFPPFGDRQNSPLDMRSRFGDAGPATPSPPPIAKAAPAVIAPVAKPAPSQVRMILVKRPAWAVHPLPAIVVSVVSMVWIFGTLLLLTRLAIDLVRLVQLRRSAIPSSEEPQQICRDVAAQMNVRAPRLMHSPFVSGPCLAGVRTPAILLPEESLDMPLAAVLVHELAHLRRGDCRWNLIRQASLALLFWQPLVWRLSRRMEEVAEEVCDDHVMHWGGDPITYASGLVRLAEQRTLPISTVVPLVTFRSLLGQRVQRILDHSRGLSLRAGMKALCAIAVAGLMITLLVGPFGSNRQMSGAPTNESAKASTNKTAEKLVKKTAGSSKPSVASKAPDASVVAKHVRGTVFLPDGTPAASAHVVLIGVPRHGERDDDPFIIGDVRSDASGQFEIPTTDLSSNRYTFVQLLARSAGTALAWSAINPDSPKNTYSIHLHEPSPARGHVVTLEGRPAAGVHLTVEFIRRSGTSVNERSESLATSGKNLPPDMWPKDVKTDANGWFAVPYVSSDIVLGLHADQEPYAPQWLDYDPSNESSSKHVYALAPAQIIKGIVIEADTGKPIAGAKVSAMQKWKELNLGMWTAQGKTDAQGRFRVNPYLATGHTITVTPPAGVPYLGKKIEFEWKDIEHNHEMRVELPRGVLAHGTITDESSGKPIAGAAVRYTARAGNTRAKGVLDDRDKPEGMSDRTGRFSLGVPPGPGHLTVKCSSGDYVLRELDSYRMYNGHPGGGQLRVNADTAIDPLAGAKDFEINFKLLRGVTVNGRVIRADGTRVERLVIQHWGTSSGTEGFKADQPEAYSGDRFEIRGVPPDGQLPVWLLDPDSRQGNAFTVRGADSAKPMVVRLLPCGSLALRYVQSDGKPIVGLWPTLMAVFTPGQLEYGAVRDDKIPLADMGFIDNFDRTNSGELSTDDSGRLTYPALIPGVQYELHDISGDAASHPWKYQEIIVHPGERKVLPDIVITDADQLRSAEENRINKEKERAKDHVISGAVAPSDTNRMSAVPLAMAAASPAASKPAATTSSVDASLQIRGQVVDPIGKPAAGAKIFINGGPLGSSGSRGQLRQFGVADADGRFAFAVTLSDLSAGWVMNRGLDSHLVAVVDGNGPAIGDLLDFDTAGVAKKLLADVDDQLIDRQFLSAHLAEKPRVLRLVSDDEPLSGRIVSLEGQPIAGARIAVYSIGYSRAGNLDAWENETRHPKIDPDKIRMGGSFSGYATAITPKFEPRTIENLSPSTEMSAAVTPVTTDRDGRFTIHGIGRERIVDLLVSGPRIETRKVSARTRNGEKLSSVYGNDFSHAAAPSNAVVGRLTDLDSGKPLAGFTVLVQKAHGMAYGEGQDYLRTTTDADGRYRLEGLPLGNDNLIAVYTTAQPYLPKSATANVDVETKPVTLDVRLLRGVWAEGRVIDKATGQPITGTVKYSIFVSNPFYKKAGRLGGKLLLGWYDTATVAADGRFRIATLPGRGILSFQALDFRKYAAQGLGAEKIAGAKPTFGTLAFLTDPICTVNQGTALREVNPPATADTIHVDFEIDTGATVTGQIVDSDGKPASAAIFCGNEPGFDLWRGTKNGTFEVHAYDPSKPRRLVFYEPRHNLAATYILQGTPPTPLVVRLEPAASLRGRLTNAHGEPLRDAVLAAHYPTYQQRTSKSVDALPLPLPPANPSFFGGGVPADHDGRFELHGLLPGRGYQLEVYNRTGQFDLGQLPHPVSAAADKTPDIGDISPAPIQAADVASGEPTTTGTAAAAEKPMQAESDARELRRVRGRVVDPHSKPVAGAQVSIVERYTPGISTWISRKVVTTKSDSAGRFELAFRKSQFNSSTHQQWQDFDIVALGPDAKLCLDWQQYESIKPGEEITLRLRTDQPVAGQIVDLQGRPVAGASVIVNQWSSASLAGPEIPFDSRWKAITGSDGRFELSGLGHGREFQAVVTGPGIVINGFQIVTASKEEAKKLGLVPEEKNPYSHLEKRFYGSGFRVVVEPAQAIEGTVRDAKSGAPLAQVLIEADQFAGWTPGQWVGGQTISDGQGRYRLDGMPKGKGNEVRVRPTQGEPYFAQELAVPTGLGFAPIKFDIKLDRGIPIYGRLTDKVSGQPIPGTGILYFPWPNNPNIQGIPEFHHGAIADLADKQTDRDGRFTVVGLPGHGLLEVVGPPRPFPIGQGFDEMADVPSFQKFLGAAGNFAPSKDVTVAVKELQIGAGASEATADIELDPGKSMTINIVDPAGKPLSGVRVAGVAPGAEEYWQHHLGPTVGIQALRPDEDRLLLLHAESRNLGKAVHVNWKKDGSGPLTVKLEPCGRLKARLLDKRGDPISFGLIMFDTGRTDVSLPEVQTDAQGRIDYAGILPGTQFEVTERKDRISFPYIVVDHLSVSPGETVDLGEFDVTTEKNRPKPIRNSAIGVTAVGAMPKDAARPADAKMEAPSAEKPASRNAPTTLPNKPGANRKADEALVRIHGRVVSPDGKPVAGAKLFTVHWGDSPFTSDEWMPWASTDANGQFEFKLAPALKDSRLVAAADGFGLAFGEVRDFDGSGGVLQSISRALSSGGLPALHLVPDDAPLTGRIISVDGQPIVGARIGLLEMWSSDQQNLDLWEKAAKAPRSDYYSIIRTMPRRENGPQLSQTVRPATTGADGRFTMRGIGRERIVRLIVSGPGIETKRIWARTRNGEKIVVPISRDRHDGDDYEFYGNGFTFVAGPSNAIVGRVTDRVTGKPLAGVTVLSQALHGTRIRGMGQDFIRTVSDGDGRYRIEGMPLGNENELGAFTLDQPYLPVSKKVRVDIGRKPITLDFQLPRGVWIEGHVADQHTGKPIPATVQYFVFGSNPFRKKIGRLGLVDLREYNRVGADGRFRIAALPGRGIVGVMADDFQTYSDRGVGAENIAGGDRRAGTLMFRTEPYYCVALGFTALAEVNPAEHADNVKLDFQIASGIKVTGRLLDPGGKPLLGAMYCGGEPAFEAWSFTTRDSFTVNSYDPNKPRRLIFCDAKRDLAAVYVLSGKPPKSLVVQLQPAGTIRGRIVDANGTPMARVQLLPMPERRQTATSSPPDNFRLPILESDAEHGNSGPVTDDQGRFEIHGLVPGHEYAVQVYESAKNRMVVQLPKPFSVRAGETKDLGDVVVKPIQMADAAEQTGATTQPAKQQGVAKVSTTPPSKEASSAPLKIRGQVLSPDGKPVAGAKLFTVGWRYGPPAAREMKPWATTGADGRFEFTVDPPRPVVYSALVAAAEGFGFAEAGIVDFDSTGNARKIMAADAIPNLSSPTPPRPAMLRLVRDDVPITGRIIDIQGRPIAGVRLSVAQVFYNREGSLDAWEKVARLPKTAGLHLHETPEGMNSPQLPLVFPEATTDSDGRFVVRGIGRERLVQLMVHGPNVETKLAWARTRRGEKIEWKSKEPPQTDFDRADSVVYASDFTFMVGPSQPLIGTVTDAETGKPIAGVSISAGEQNTFTAAGKPWVDCMTDAAGRYTLEGLEEGRREKINVIPPADSPYVPIGASITVKLSRPAPHRDFKLRSGVLVRGHVIDERTGKPVSGAVQYAAYETNPNLDKAYRGFSQLRIFYERRAEADGRFAIAVLPGMGVVSFEADDFRHYRRGVGQETLTGPLESAGLYRTEPTFLTPVNVHIVHQVDLPVGSPPVEIKLALRSGVDIDGRIIDPDGHPAAANLSGEDPDGMGSWSYKPQDTFKVLSYEPTRPRRLVFFEPKRNLAALYTLSGEPPKPFVVRLQPAGAVRGRLVDDRGRPVAHGSIYDEFIPPVGFGTHSYPTTDDEGRFELRGLIPNREYSLMVSRRQKQFTIEEYATKSFSVRGGETKDLGDIVVVSERPKKPATARKSAVSEKLRAVKRVLSAAQMISRKAVDDALQIHGQVLDPRGKPLAGADVKGLLYCGNGMREALPPLTAKSDSTGRFTFKVHRAQLAVDRPEDEANIYIAASVMDNRFGPDWLDYDPSKPPHHVTLTLVDDEPIEGRLTDLEGKPIAGARVSVRGPSPSGKNDLTAWLAAVKRGLPYDESKTPTRSAVSYLDSERWKTTTDADGKFQIKGLGRERMAILEVSSAGFVDARFTVVTRKMDRVRAESTGPHYYNTPVTNFYYGAHFQALLEPARTVEGIIRDAKTGKPLPGVHLSADGWNGAGQANVVTNKNGYYKFAGLPQSEQSVLLILPEGQPYFSCQFEAPAAVGVGQPAKLDLQLHRGVVVHGRLTDKTTGKPIADSDVQYVPWPNNPNFKQTLELAAEHRLPTSDHRTDQDGRFTLVALPGRGLIEVLDTKNTYYPAQQGRREIADFPSQDEFSEAVGVWAPGSYMTAFKEVRIADGATETSAEIQLQSVKPLTLRIVDPQGRPLTSVRVNGIAPPLNIHELRSAGPSADILALGPNEQRLVLLYQKERNLGKATLLSWKNCGPGPFTVTLEPCARLKVRLLGPHGEPLPNAQVSIAPKHGHFGHLIDYLSCATDADGRLDCKAVLPGATYRIYCQSPAVRGAPFIAEDLKVNPGETIDFGDFNTGKGKHANKPIRSGVMTSMDSAALQNSSAGTQMPQSATTGLRNSVAGVEKISDDSIHVHGRVVGPRGDAVAGAEVSVVQTYWELNRISRRIATTSSDSGGHFELKYRKSQFVPQGAEPWQSATIVAMPRDSSLGPALCNSGSIKPADEVTLQLVADEPIEGRLVDLEGKPVVGAEVRVTFMSAIKGDDLTAWLEAVKKGVPERSIPNYENLFRSLDTGFAGKWQTKTDAAGRFRFSGLGRDMFTSIHVAAAGFVPLTLHVATRQFTPVKVDHTVLGGPANVVVEYGSHFQLALEPSQRIEGTVRDAANNQPIAGAKIIYEHHHPSYDASAVSGSNGHYRLEGIPKAADNEITVVPAQGQPYFVRHFKLPAAPGYEPVKFDFVLHRGALIHGQVTEKVTGKPIVGAWIDYVPWPKNPKIRDTLEAARDHMYAPQNRCLTDRDGRFTLVGIAGRGLVEILHIDAPYPAGQGLRDIRDMPTELEFVQEYCGIAPSPRYPVAVKEVRPDDSLAAVEADFQLDPGHTLTLNVVDPAGAPISALFVDGVAPPARRFERENIGPSVAIEALGSDEDRLVFIYQKERKLGKVVHIRWKADGPGPATVKIEPCATLKARALDQHGLPVRGGMVKFYAEDADFAKDLRDGGTDLDGRLNYTSLLPGGTYRVLIGCPQLGFVPDVLVGNLSPAPGEVIDLGEFDVTTKTNRPKPIRATMSPNNPDGASTYPARKLSSVRPADDFVHIHGRVVGPRGNASSVAEVSILVNDIRLRDPLARVASVKSDVHGRFDLRVPKTQFDAWGNDSWKYSTIIVSTTDGSLGIDWRSYAAVKPNEDVVLNLVPDEPIDGHLTDLEGQPIVGATISVNSILTNTANDLTPWLVRIKRGVPEMRQHTVDGLDKGVWSDLSVYWQATTDSQGRFRFTGIGRDRIAGLKIVAAGHVPVILNVMTEPIEPVTAKSTKTHEIRPDGDDVFYGSHLRFAMEPSQPIEGVVRDGKTGAPLPNVRIVADTFAGTAINTVTGLETTSDTQGHYRLDGMPKGKGNVVIAIPPDGQPYFMRDFEVPTASDLQPVKFDLDLRRGVPIHGRLTDRLTGAPIEGACIIYVPWPSNPNIRGLPEFNRYYMPGTIQQDRYQTDRHGRFTQVGFPGRGLLEVYNPPRPYPTGQGFHAIKELPNYGEFMKIAGAVAPSPRVTTAIKEIHIGDGQESVTADIRLESTKPVTLNIIDPAGKPLSGIQSRGTSDHDGYDRDVGPSIDVQALAPDENRFVILYQPARNLGKAISVSLKQGAAGPLTVKLEPCGTVKARLLDHYGQPLRHAAIYASVDRFRLPNGTTDDDGRVTYRSLLPGTPCELTCDDLQVGKECSIANNLTVTPGETIDLGQFDVTSNKHRPNPIRTGGTREAGLAERLTENSASMPAGGRPPDVVRAMEAHLSDTAVGPKSPPVASTNGTESNDALHIRGRVVDPQGTPVAAAEVSVIQTYRQIAPREARVASTKTSADGRFDLEFHKSQFVAYRVEPWRFAVVAAFSPDMKFGPAWKNYASIADRDNLTLQLVRDEPIEGQIIDLEGKPIVGVDAKVAYLTADMQSDVNAEDIASKSAIPFAGNQGFEEPDRFLSTRFIAGWQARTDSDGRFRISGAGRDRVAHIDVSGPGIVPAELRVVARPMQTVKAPDLRAPKIPESSFLYGSHFRFAAEPSQPVEGVVRDAATSKPLAGVRVVASQLAGANGSVTYWTMLIGSVSDKAGRYRLDGMPKGPGNRIVALPSDGQPYFSRAFGVPPAREFQSVKFDLGLHRGRLIHGRVTNAATGEPVAGARMEYVPWPTSPMIKGMPEFDYGWVGLPDGRHETDRDGNYTLVGLPGRGLIEVGYCPQPFSTGQGLDEIHDFPNERQLERVTGRPPDQRYPTAIKSVQIGNATDRDAHVDFTLDVGKRVTLKLVDPQGQPLAGVRIDGLLPNIDLATREGAGPTADVVALGPKEKRLVLLYQKQRNLGKAIQVAWKDNGPGPITVRLEPCATLRARVLNELHEPVRDGYVMFFAQHGAFSLWLPYAKTDGDGRLNYTTLLPGGSYRVICVAHDFHESLVDGELTPVPGEVIDLGEFDATAKVRPKIIRTTMANSQLPASVSK